MSRLLTLALGVAIFATHHVDAQSQAGTVQALWEFPSIPDYSDVLYVGQVYTLRWNTSLQYQFAAFCPACDTANVALYASGGVDDSDVWLINDGISVQATTSLSWLVDVPTSDLQDSTQWNLQFVQSGTKPQVNAGQISSPRIFIRPANVTTTTTTSTPTSTPTTTTTTAPPSTGLSTGAKAGIGVGAALGGLALIGALIFGFILLQRRTQKPRSSSIAQAEQAPALGGGGGAFGAATDHHSGPPEYYDPKDNQYTPYSDAGTGAGELPVKRPTGEGLAPATGPHELENFAPTGELEANPLPPQELPGESHHKP